MYYYCAKMSAFKLPALVQDVPAGGVIAASAMTCGTLERRTFMSHPHLVHRVLDPQLYLATLDPANAANTIFKLGTYNWFGTEVPTYSSDIHGTHASFKDLHKEGILESWSRTVPNTDSEILELVKNCLQFQIDLGCDMLVGPAPLTNQALTFALEIKYLDALCIAANQLKTRLPVFATLAITDTLLQNIDPLKNVLLQTIADQISARSEISGLYLVPEQSAETGYVCMSEDVLYSILVLIDDIAKGARKRLIVNYLGSFGPVIAAVGGEIWTSGYYRSQRRMRLADQIEMEGRAYPRFFSHALAGDIGVEKDLPALHGEKVFTRIFSRTLASRSLFQALNAGTVSADWEYKIGNIWPASAHYNDVMVKFSGFLDSHSMSGKIQAIQDWLERSCDAAEALKKLDVDATHTDVRHQKIWLSAFQKWMKYSAE
jgi:hypothetical protein